MHADFQDFQENLPPPNQGPREIQDSHHMRFTEPSVQNVLTIQRGQARRDICGCHAGSAAGRATQGRAGGPENRLGDTTAAAHLGGPVETAVHPGGSAEATTDHPGHQDEGR